MFFDQGRYLAEAERRGERRAGGEIKVHVKGRGASSVEKASNKG